MRRRPAGLVAGALRSRLSAPVAVFAVFSALIPPAAVRLRRTRRSATVEKARLGRVVRLGAGSPARPAPLRPFARPPVVLTVAYRRRPALGRQRPEPLDAAEPPFLVGRVVVRRVAGAGSQVVEISARLAVLVSTPRSARALPAANGVEPL